MVFSAVRSSFAATARPQIATAVASRPAFAPFSTSACRFVSPNQNPEATGSEEAVHAEKTETNPKELQSKTAAESQSKKHVEENKAVPNDDPTDSEDAVHGTRHEKDPLKGKK